METKQKRQDKKYVVVRIVVCAIILMIGWAGMNGLASLKKPPAEAKFEERAIKVQVQTAQPNDFPVVITGYGEARALTVVTIAPEVSGRVVYTTPELNVGRRIPSGDIIFRIDPADYEAGLQEAEAGVAQWQNTVARLKKQFDIDSQRLKTLKRSAHLSKTEFERVKRLYTSDRVGTRSGVDQAERAYNSALDQADQIAQAVSLYPLQIREAESSLASARARLSIAATSLARCTVRAPFDARVKSVSIETGQFVSPGQNVLNLADDSMLEIQVPLASRESRRWLMFDDWNRDQPATAWFTGLKPVACTVRWTEDKAGSVWSGTLNRVVKFDQQTRTITVAVRVSAEAAASNRNQGLPLVEGMFCAVEIPGRTMRDVFRLPRQAVSFENKVYLSNAEGRLQTAAVTVERIEGEFVFVSRGLKPGDSVITTRLIDPLENVLLEIAEDKPAKESAS